MKKTIKTYEENGIKYQFDAKSLDAQINQRKHYSQKTKRKITKAAIMEELADMLFVSTEAVKNWMYGNNGPSELEQVKSLAEYFKIDYHQLLKKEEGQMANAIQKTFVNNIQQVQYTKDRVREIYHAILIFLSECRHSIYYYGELYNPIEPDESIEKDILMARGNLVEKFHEICNLLEEALLDIPADFYSKLHDYIWSDLYGKIDEVMTMLLTHPDELDGYYLGDGIDIYYETGYIIELREIFEDYIVR